MASEIPRGQVLLVVLARLHQLPEGPADGVVETSTTLQGLFPDLANFWLQLFLKKKRTIGETQTVLEPVLLGKLYVEERK